MCPLGPQGHGEGKRNPAHGYTEPPARTPSYEKYLDEPDSLDDWLAWRAGLDPNYNLGYTFLELLKRTPAGVPRYLTLDELTDTTGAGIPDVIVDFFGVDTSDPLFADSDTGGTGYSLTERYWAGEDLGDSGAAALSWANDGVPNVWKLRYGLDPVDPTVSFADPDEDGHENFVEYLLGRDPLVADLGSPGKGTAPDAAGTLQKAAARATSDDRESKGASAKEVARRSSPVANNLTPPPDTDADGLDDTLDADPNDPVVNWLRAPESRYLVIPLGGVWSPKFINDNSEVLGEFQDEDSCSCDPVDRQFAVWKDGTWTELNTAVALLDKKPGAPSQTQTRKVQVVTGLDNTGAIYGEVTSLGQPDCGVYPEYGPGAVRWASSTATPQLIISQKLYETTTSGSLEKTHLARYLPGGLSWNLEESDFTPNFTPNHLVATLESELQINGQVFEYSLDTTYVLGACSVVEVDSQVESGTRYEVRGTTRSGFGILKDLNNFQAGSAFHLINPAGALEALTGSFAGNSVKIIESPPPTSTVGRPILVIPSGPYATSSHIKSLYGWEATQTSIPGGKMNSQGIAIGNGSSSIWRNGQTLPMVSLVDEKEADGVTPVWNGFGLIDINSSGVIAAVGLRGEEGEFEPVLLVPVDVVELSPKLRDSDNNEITGSEVPKSLPESNPTVEEAPNTNRIAHRELKVRVGVVLKNKKVTWSMDPKFTPEGQSEPSFRGDWAEAAATHQDRFEASTAYGAHSYSRISQEQAETTIGVDGFTAIRVNLPPIGFNKARIKIQVEGTQTPIELGDLDVQAVIVIDPGHGGTPQTDFPSASWNHATSPSGVMEKTMALSYGLALKTSLEAHAQNEHLNLKVLITRSTDTAISGRDRAYLARDNGADQIFIIHFNASQQHTARGSLEVRQDPNLTGSLQEDIDFIDAVLDRMVTAMQPFDAGCNRRAEVLLDTTVATDTYLGNENDYHPVRAGYCEVEFIDFGAHTPSDPTDDAVDILLNTGPNAGAVKTAITNAMRDGIIHDLKSQPEATP